MQVQQQVPRRTYRAAFQVIAVAGVAPFFAIVGAAGRVIRITRIEVTGPTLTAVQYLRVALAKYSTAISAGTATNPTKVPLDSLAPASMATLNNYSAAPTPGTLVGSIAERTVLGQATVAAAGGPEDNSAQFDFTNGEISTEYPTLRGIAENIGVLFSVAPATAVTLSMTVEYTEDGN